MNRLVAWNESIHLPSSWSGLESVLRDSENAAQAMVQQIMGGSTVWDLIAAILIVGVLTGIAEELFFRGALQRLLQSKFGNKHLAIWSAAFIFSAVHLQFFGFFPRLLMGAYFGYLVVWSGSLRLSMSVSYTHLDVYKRQAFHIIAEERGYGSDYDRKHQCLDYGCLLYTSFFGVP